MPIETNQNESIKPGVFVDPHVLYGERLLPLDDDLASEIELDAEAILRRSTRRTEPPWMAALSLTGRVRIQRALAEKGFSPLNRLDDFTLIAPTEIAPTDSGKPLRILELHQPGIDLTQFTLDGLEKAIRETPVEESSGTHLMSGDYLFRAIAVNSSDLPPQWTFHQPGNFLREQYRVIFVFDRFELGSPISALTLMPGESRKIRITEKTSIARKEVSKITVTDVKSSDLTNSLQKTFKDSWKSNSTRARELASNWSTTRNLDLEEGWSSSFSLKVSDNRNFNVEDVVEDFQQTVETTTRKHNINREEVHVSEMTKEQSTEIETEDKFELTNPHSKVAITYISHHILGIYWLHFDLVNVDIVISPPEPGAPTILSLDRNFERRLSEALPGANTEDIAARIQAELQERYGQFEIAENPGGFTLARPNHDYVNQDLVQRELMMSANRPGTGPLPICLRSHPVALRSGSVFVKSYTENLEKPAESAATEE